MTESRDSFRIEPGARVFVNQAFTCCPYAAVITSKIHDFFEQNRCEISDHPRDAVLTVINTCGFNASRSQQAIKTIGAVRKMAPTSPVVVAGCLTQIEREQVRRALAGGPPSLLIGPHEHELFDGLLAERRVPFQSVRTNLYKDRYASRDPRMGLFQVLVSVGCTNQCTYCVIRKAKGTVKSKPLDEIVREVTRGFEAGYQDIFLVGDDIASWGADRETDVGELLAALVHLDGEGQYSAEAFEPSRLMPHLDRVLPLMSSGRFAWIVVPVQSGSDRVLQAMGRNYDRRAAEALVATLKKAAPDMIVSTDFIFGFAGETRAEFEQSLELARHFDYANFNEYEQRPGTPPLEVPEDEMEHRRQVVMEYLREQGSQIQVLTKNRNIPCEALMGQPSSSDGAKQHTEWVIEHARKLRELFEQKGAELAEGWAVGEVKEDANRIVLLVRHPEQDEIVEFMVSKRDEKIPCIAFSDDYNFGLIWEKDSPCVLDEAQIEAMETLRGLLGLGTES